VEDCSNTLVLIGQQPDPTENRSPPRRAIVAQRRL